MLLLHVQTFGVHQEVSSNKNVYRIAHKDIWLFNVLPFGVLQECFYKKNVCGIACKDKVWLLRVMPFDV